VACCRVPSTRLGTGPEGNEGNYASCTAVGDSLLRRVVADLTDGPPAVGSSARPGIGPFSSSCHLTRLDSHVSTHTSRLTHLDSRISTHASRWSDCLGIIIVSPRWTRASWRITSPVGVARPPGSECSTPFQMNPQMNPQMNRPRDVLITGRSRERRSGGLRPKMAIQRPEHVGIVFDVLGAAVEFFVQLAERGGWRVPALADGTERARQAA
jgi:hypothetical protein